MRSSQSKRSDELLRSTGAVVVGVTTTSRVIAYTFGNRVRLLLVLQAAIVLVFGTTDLFALKALIEHGFTSALTQL